MRTNLEIESMDLSELDRRLLNDYPRGFPLSPAPFADIARELGTTEEEVIERIRVLAGANMISRIGAVIRPRTIGASTLAAIKVPPERLLEIAALVSSYPEVNHNYEREHDLNLWFVINATNKEHLQNVLQDIEARTALQVLSLPMLADFHIDLGFDLQWT